MEQKTYRVRDGDAVLHLTLDQLMEGASVQRHQMLKRLHRSQRDLGRLRESPQAARQRQLRVQKAEAGALFEENRLTRNQGHLRLEMNRTQWTSLQRKS